MLKRQLDIIAKEKEIPRNVTKAEMIEKLVEILDLDDVRKYYYSELFGCEHFNVLNHMLVLPHRILSLEEKKELKKKYGLKSLKQLPKIKVSDPVIIAIGGLIGDVVEIIRNSTTAGKSKYYRLVVRSK